MIRPGQVRWRNPLRCSAGAVAVEFALAVPILVLLLTGVLAVSQTITVGGKVSMAASTMADLVTQLRTVTAADRSDVVLAGQQILHPDPADAGTFGGHIICVAFTPAGASYQPSIVWQHSFGSAPGPTPDLKPLVALAQPGVSVVFVSLSYLYRPIVVNAIFDHVSFERTAVARMRLTPSC